VTEALATGTRDGHRYAGNARCVLDGAMLEPIMRTSSGSLRCMAELSAPRTIWGVSATPTVCAYMEASAPRLPGSPLPFRDAEWRRCNARRSPALQVVVQSDRFRILLERFVETADRLSEPRRPYQREGQVIVRFGLCGVEFDRFPTGGRTVRIWAAHGLLKAHAYTDKPEYLYEPTGSDAPRKAQGRKLVMRRPPMSVMPECPKEV
jgi:hypothetical protein